MMKRVRAFACAEEAHAFEERAVCDACCGKNNLLAGREVVCT